MRRPESQRAYLDVSGAPRGHSRRGQRCEASLRAALTELEEAVALAERLLGPDGPVYAKYRASLEACRAALAR